MNKQDGENIIVIPEKKQSGVSRALDRFFHFTQRGSSVGSELGAGMGAFFLAVCALMMNTQIVGGAYGSYAGSYLAVALVSLFGTVLLGVLCNLPLVQTANMGLSALLISMLGTDTGLTYANLMAVTFVAAVIYLIVVLTPAKKLLVDALPDGVRKAMPVAVGLYVALTALKNAGLVNGEGRLIHAARLGTLDAYYFWLMVAAVFVFILLKAFRRRKAAVATFGILIGLMWVGGIVFFMEQFIGGQTAATVVYQRLNLVVATDGASPYNIAAGLQSLNVGALFREGFDFSGYTGSVPLLFLQGVLNFLFLGLYTNLGNAKAAAAAGDYDGEDYARTAEGGVLAVGAALNVAAPILGASPTSIGVQSAAASGDRGKTGLAALAAAGGYLIAIFSWVFVMFFATGTNGVGMWVEETETKLAAYVQDTFVFADLVMALVGASMLKGIGKLDASRLTEFLPFAATVVAAAFLGNIALGVSLGCVAYVICKAAGKERRELTPACVLLGAVMLVFTIVTLL